MALQHLRSSTADKRPVPGNMSDGQLGINTNTGSPGLFFKDSNNTLVKVGPVHVGTTAPNASPASGGTAGNSVGEQWLDTTGGTYAFKMWDGSAWRNVAGTFVEDKNIIIGNVDTPTDVTADGGGITLKGATDKTINWVDATDAWTSSERFSIPLGSTAAPSLTFTGDPNTGIYSPGADQVAISTNGTRRLIILSDGKVGLGAASVLQQGSGVDGGSGAGILELYNGGTGNTTLENTGAFPILFKTSGTERLRITSAGLVGVGTSSPFLLFDCAGTGTGVAYFRTTDTGSSNNINIANGSNFSAGVIGVVSGTGSSGGDVYGLGHTPSTSSTDLTPVLTWTSGNRVGIGSSSPGATLNVIGNAWFQDSASSGAIVNIRGLSDKALVDTNTYGAAMPLVFGISGTERARIDSSGRLLVGTSSASVFTFGGVTPRFQVEGTDASTGALAIARNSNDANGAGLIISKSRGTTAGSCTIVSNNDTIADIRFEAGDGTQKAIAAGISCQVDGTPGANDMPGRIVLSTTADGASSPTERMRIRNNGRTDFIGTATDYTLVTATSQSAGTTTEILTGVYGSTGVGSGTVSFRVYSNGNVQNTNNSYGAISDIKLKENIADANSQWSDIKALQVRKYNFKEGQTHTQIGLIAQEVEQVSPGLVTESPDRDEEGNDLGTVTKSVNYSVLYMKAVKALQEAMERIETLEQRLNDAGIN